MLKTNSVLEVITKKVVVKKVVSEATKKAIAKKRKLNPQFANVQSAKRKSEVSEFKANAKANLIEVRRTSNLQNVDLLSVENMAHLTECKKAINYILKNDDLVSLTIQAVRTHKGAFVTYYFEQLIQKIVKLKDSKNLDYKTSLNSIIAKNLIDA